MVISKILGIACSGRKTSNSGRLLDISLKRMEELGHFVEKIYLQDYHILPCQGCEACNVTGACVINDDMNQLYDKVFSSDFILLSTPVYFYSLPGHAKIFVDRFQPFWAKKYKHHEKLPKAINGAFIAIGGSAGQKSFDSIRLTYKYFLDTLDGKIISEPLLFRNWDKTPGLITDEMIKKTLDFAEKNSKLLYDLQFTINKE